MKDTSAFSRGFLSTFTFDIFGQPILRKRYKKTKEEIATQIKNITVEESWKAAGSYLRDAMTEVEVETTNE
jgi:hypothetical protein